jgi:hypothetical protein
MQDTFRVEILRSLQSTISKPSAFPQSPEYNTAASGKHSHYLRKKLVTLTGHPQSV